ncbi:MAG: hypothetical protein H0Z32_02010 [Bacillaceae bacterium]|nr:hypothetical protein [Bacillaceae bacterium]
MLTFLVIFSLILHGITLALFIFLYRKYNMALNSDQQYKKSMREMENLFNSYLLELKEENEKLVKILNDDKKEENNKPNPDLKEMPPKRPVEKQLAPVHKNKGHYQPEKLLENDQIRVEQPSYKSKALQLYKEGYSIDEIAQKLNKGKTEIELIVKFYT